MVSDVHVRLSKFVDFVHEHLEGYEKGEGQIFCEHFFRAFGHDGVIQAGGKLEHRVHSRNKPVSFADLRWKTTLLLEMKKSGERLERHYNQAFDYWLNLTPDKPTYVVLCNFDEFWIYDLNRQLHDPLDKVRLDELPSRYRAFGFMFTPPLKPQFGTDKEAVTREAAHGVSQVFRLLRKRGIEQEPAQRFILQCVVAMFAQSADLLPKGLFNDLLEDCLKGEKSSNVIGDLFRQMDDGRGPSKSGRYARVPYFNGGLFSQVDAIDLQDDELGLMRDAASMRWSEIQPLIFGTLFQSSMLTDERAALGAQFTHEVDIQRVVLPTIVRPWRQRIEETVSVPGLKLLRKWLSQFKVLDPACGSGNFLYVAYRELVRLELAIVQKLYDLGGLDERAALMKKPTITTKQFFGIDKNAFAVELARVTMMLAKELACEEVQLGTAKQLHLPIDTDPPLPLDNLDQNIMVRDALFDKWPRVNAIIGNPPYQAKNKRLGALEMTLNDPGYMNRLKQKYPDVDQRSDYCVYWFRRAQDEIPVGGRVGLVGTKSIKENFSRESGLDYIVGEGGVITEAVSQQKWTGEANLDVSIVNWIDGGESQAFERRPLVKQTKKKSVEGKRRGKNPKLRRIYTELGRNNWTWTDVPVIPPTLSTEPDVTSAITLTVNEDSDSCHQGQTHGHEGFSLTADAARAMVRTSKANSEVIFPRLNNKQLLNMVRGDEWEYAIDFHRQTDINAASRFKLPFQHVKAQVLPDRKNKAKERAVLNEAILEEDPEAHVNTHHQGFLRRWWQFAYPRPHLIEQIMGLRRYIAGGQTAKHGIFQFLSPTIRPTGALIVFPFEDYYSFGIIQSDVFWRWQMLRGSKHVGRRRFTLTTIYDSFPWPQSPSEAAIKAVALAAEDLWTAREELLQANRTSLHDLYATLELPGDNPLQDHHDFLNSAVRKAYGISKGEDAALFILRLNQTVAIREANGEQVWAPGPPAYIENNRRLYVSNRCLKPPPLR